MRHVVFRLFMIILASLYFIFYITPWKSLWIDMPFSGDKDYRLGLDLQGGIELDYKVDFTELRASENFDKNNEKEAIEWLKSIIDRRVETLNINDSEINDASYWWENHIVVQIPLKWNDKMENMENIEKAKEAIWKVVKIQFKEKRKEFTEEDVLERTAIAENAYKEITDWERFSVVSDKYILWYENVFRWKSESLSKLKEDINITSTEELSIDELNKVEALEGDIWYLILNKDEKDNSYDFIYISWTPSLWIPAQDSKWRILDDKYFIKSSVQFNEAYQPLVELTFNKEWAEIFYELTKRLVWQQIAIFVWWDMLTAPNVNEAIPWGKAVITWQESVESAKKLSQNINTWVVPAPIYLTSEKTIDSKIWTDSLDKLIVSWLAWFVLIFIFLIYVYRLSWVMASISLFIYSVLILVIVKLFWVVLTMASIAWLILSIWMAIDANILILERIKEKLSDWEIMLDAIDSGFKESWSAIWDSNFTWILVAVILFVFGVNMIKGFGLMLWIWLILSLFTVMLIFKVFILWLWLIIKDKKIFIWYKWDKK